MLAKIGRSLLRIIVVIVLVGGAVQLYLLRGSKASPIQPSNPRVEYRSTPTLLIPGWGGNSWTYQKLIQTAQQKRLPKRR